MKSNKALVLKITFLILILFKSVGADQKYIFTTDWVTANSENWLKHLSQFKGKPNIHGLEIGTWEGRSAIWFLENILTHPSATITCVDTFYWGEGTEDRFDKNIRASGLAQKVKKIKGQSQFVLMTLERSHYDFVYIDGCHRAACVLTDVILSFYLTKPGGLIILDDYLYQPDRKPIETPKIAIDAFLVIFKPYIEILDKKYQVIIKKKDLGLKEDININP